LNERGRAEFTEFVTARSHALIRLAYVLTSDQHAAEDLLQSALTKAAAHWGRIHSSPEAYVRRIMYRDQVSIWRQRARRNEVPVAVVPEHRSENPFNDFEERTVLLDAIRALPAGKRAVLVLRYLEDLPESQVANILGCSVGTVRSQTHRAVAQLRLALPVLDFSDTEVNR